MKKVWSAALLVALTLLAARASATQSSPLAFVPKGYRVVDTIRGDLNKDGEEDVVLLIKAADPSMIVSDARGEKLDRNRRGLVIAFKQGMGYALALKNFTCFSSENEDGGVYFAPELSIDIKKGLLLFHYSHGRYGYWGYTFRYQKGGFYLIGYDASNDHGPVVESVVSINLMTGRIWKRVNTNEDAEGGGEEDFKDSWSKITKPRVISLEGIKDFDSLDVTDMFEVWK
ncbi:hypothetical protein ACQVBX_06105 [Dyella sp. KULCS107]|uniref:hypothetical protein n=1 Tax=Dyella sp. KULCS107 TaxID=3422216 RepID=UPI003D6DCA42